MQEINFIRLSWLPSETIQLLVSLLSKNMKHANGIAFLLAFIGTY